MVYERDEIVAIERADLNLPNIEMLWLEIKVQTKRLCLVLTIEPQA